MNVVVSQSETILELVRTRLAQNMHEQSGEELQEIEIMRTLTRPYSLTTFLKAVTDRGTRSTVLKQIVEHPLNAPTDQAAVEYGILTKTYPRFADINRCSVPRPILALPEINAYLMEFVDGDVLADRLNLLHYLADRAGFSRLLDHFHDCGRWLRHFQEFTGRRSVSVNAVDNLLVRCHDRLELIEKAGDPRCPKDFRRRATDYVEKQVDRLANVEIPVTGRHGDFGPWNILANDEGVTVIDFFGCQEDPLPVDILSMLVYLDSQEYGLGNSVARIRALRDRFITGFGAIPTVPEPLVLLCEAQQRILQIAGRVIAERKGFFDRWERAGSLRANVKWFMRAPEQSSLWPK